MIIRKKRLTKLLKDGVESGLKEEKNAPGFHSFKSSYSSFRSSNFSDSEDDEVLSKGKTNLAIGAGVGLGIGGLSKLGLEEISPTEAMSRGEIVRDGLKKKYSNRKHTLNPIKILKDVWTNGESKKKDLEALQKRIDNAEEVIKEKYKDGIPFRGRNNLIAGGLGTLGALGTIYYLTDKDIKKRKAKKTREESFKNSFEDTLRESSSKFEKGEYNPEFHKSTWEKSERKSLFDRFKNKFKKKSTDDEQKSKVINKYVLPIEEDDSESRHSLNLDKIVDVSKNALAGLRLSEKTNDFFKNKIDDIKHRFSQSRRDLGPSDYDY
jgi:hypothetical protein